MNALLKTKSACLGGLFLLVQYTYSTSFFNWRRSARFRNPDWSLLRSKIFFCQCTLPSVPHWGGSRLQNFIQSCEVKDTSIRLSTIYIQGTPILVAGRDYHYYSLFLETRAVYLRSIGITQDEAETQAQCRDNFL